MLCLFAWRAVTAGTGDLFLSLLAAVHLTVIGHVLWFCMLLKGNM